jgi:integrase
MTGIIRDKWGWRAFVKVGKIQREKRFPPDETIRKMQAWRDECRVALRKLPQAANGRTGSFGADVKTYLEQIKPTIALATYRSRVCELDAYLAAFRSVPRADITRAKLLELRTQWMTTGRAKHTGKRGASAKTVRNRETALRHLYHRLDGAKAPTPLDDMPPLPKTPARPQFVSVATIRRVWKRLTDPKTRARFMVLTATGQRPAQLKRAIPTDIDLRRRLWLVRPAKGGHPIPVTLTDDMIEAFKALRAADAFGYFDGSDYAKELYAAGWPKGVRPYNAKHTVALALAESGAEWDDIKDYFGHTDVKTTRIYTGLVAARGRNTSALLDGRIGWK